VIQEAGLRCAAVSLSASGSPYEEDSRWTACRTGLVACLLPKGMCSLVEGHGRVEGIDHWCYAPERDAGDAEMVGVGGAAGGGHSEHALALEQRRVPGCAPSVDAGSSWAAGSASSAARRGFAPDQTRPTRLVFGDCSLAEASAGLSADGPTRWPRALEAVPSAACRWYAASPSGRVPDARRPYSRRAAVVDVTDVTAGAARDPCGCLPSLLDSSLEAALRLQSMQPSQIYSTINQQDARQSRRKPRASNVAWQVARLTLETAAFP
jgi:hypothetical protein